MLKEQVSSVGQTILRDITDLFNRNDVNVVSLEGKWGVGKTHLLKSDETIGSVKWVSLFGVPSEKVFLGRLLFGTDYGESTQNFAEKAMSGFRGLVDKMSDNQLTASLIKGVVDWGCRALIPKFLGEGSWVVVDDMERISARYPLEQLLGLIETIKQNQNCKFILVGNFEELSPEQREVWNRYKEKLVRHSFHFYGDPEYAVNVLMKKHYPEPKTNQNLYGYQFLNEIEDSLKSLKVINIRIGSLMINNLRVLLRKIPILQQPQQGDFISMILLVSYIYQNPSIDKKAIFKAISKIDENDDPRKYKELIRFGRDHKMRNYMNFLELLWRYFTEGVISQKDLDDFEFVVRQNTEIKRASDIGYEIIRQYVFNPFVSVTRLGERIENIASFDYFQSYHLKEFEKILSRIKGSKISDFYQKCTNAHYIQNIQALLERVEWRDGKISAQLQEIFRRKLEIIIDDSEVFSKFRNLLTPNQKSPSLSDYDKALLAKVSSEHIQRIINENEDGFELLCKFLRFKGKRQEIEDFVQKLEQAVIRIECSNQQLKRKRLMSGKVSIFKKQLGI